MASPSKRRELDVMKLMSEPLRDPGALPARGRHAQAAGGVVSAGAGSPGVFPGVPLCHISLLLSCTAPAVSDYKVDLVEDNISEMNVEFRGPKDSERGGAGWRAGREW